MLVHKVYLLWRDTFQTPEVLRARLQTHKQKLDWQIRRIYRARNFVMHRGRSVPGLRQLIQHLHSYYIMLVHAIIHELRFRPEWGIAEVCESRKSVYADALRRLKTHEDYPVAIEDLLFFFSPRAGQRTNAWPHLMNNSEPPIIAASDEAPPPITAPAPADLASENKLEGEAPEAAV